MAEKKSWIKARDKKSADPEKKSENSEKAAPTAGKSRRASLYDHPRSERFRDHG